MNTSDSIEQELHQMIEATQAPETGEHLPDPTSGLCDVVLTGTMIREWGREGTIISMDLWGGIYMTPDGPMEVEELSITVDSAVGGPAHADAVTGAKELGDVIALIHAQQLSFDLYSQPGKVSLFTDGKWTLALPRIGGGE